MDSHPGLKALRIAMPYIRAYKGATFVIKLGGNLCRIGLTLDGLADQIAVLYHLGIRVVVVHGGGPQATELTYRLGLSPQIIAGRRITDAKMLEIAKMTFAGTVNSELLAAFRKAKVPAVGLSGIDANLVTAHRRPVQLVSDPSTGQSQEVDFGFVGDIEQVEPAVLQYLLSGGFVPVVCSLGADAAGQIFNINADTLAVAVAVALGAMKYFSLTSVDGVLDDLNDPRTLHSYVDIAEAETLVKSGKVSGGMLPKLAACLDALRAGVPRVHIVNGERPDALLQEIFTNEGCGTLIVAERNRPGDAAAEADAQAADEAGKP